MTAPTTSTDAGESLRYVYVERARCPRCFSTNLKTTKTETHGDESVTRHTTCRDCGHKFFIVVE